MEIIIVKISKLLQALIEAVIFEQATSNLSALIYCGLRYHVQKYRYRRGTERTGYHGRGETL